MIEEAKGDHQKMWKAVNEVCNRNSTSENVQCIISDGIQHTTPKSIASALNSFFASIGRRLADKIRTIWPNRVLVLEQQLSQLQLTELEESFVLQQLTTLKAAKSFQSKRTQPDFFPYLFLRLCSARHEIKLRKAAIVTN
jgi:hypothetical protein